MKCTFIEYPNLPRLEVSSTDSYNDADKDSKRKKRKNHIRAIPVAVKIRQNIFASRRAKKKEKKYDKTYRFDHGQFATLCSYCSKRSNIEKWTF